MNNVQLAIPIAKLHVIYLKWTIGDWTTRNTRPARGSFDWYLQNENGSIPDTPTLVNGIGQPDTIQGTALEGIANYRDTIRFILLTDSWSSESYTFGDTSLTARPWIYPTFTICRSATQGFYSSYVSKRIQYPTLGTGDLAKYATWGKVDPTTLQPLTPTDSGYVGEPGYGVRLLMNNEVI